MKICYVANSRFPSERAHMTQIVQMCNAFAALGHEVSLLVTDRETKITESPETFFGVDFHFNVVRIQVPDIAGKAKYIPSFMRPYMFMIQRIAFSKNAAKYIRTSGCDLLYGRDEWILWFFSKKLRTQMIWESHEAKYSFVVRRLLPRLKRLVVISEGIQEYYLKRGIENVLVAHDAVDARFFEPHITQQDAWKLLGITPTKPVVMYIGGLESWKGAQTLCAAAQGHTDFEVYIVGGREDEVAKLRSQYPSVHFLGARPYRDLSKVQQAADVLVIPNTATTSLSAEYTSPLKLFTYMTAGKPIAASRVASITNVLTDNEAFLCAVDDPHALCNIIKEILQNREEGNRRAQNAKVLSHQYTWESRARTILTI